MLKFENWFLITWTVVIGLYSLGWSGLNSSLTPGIWSCFLVGAIIAIACSILRSRIFGKVKFFDFSPIGRRRPTITILLAFGFAMDFAYVGEIPLLTPYSGYDINADIQATAGIPYVHVIIVSLALYYSMYLAYLFVCTREKKFLVEFGAIVLCFLLSNSRSYIVFAIIMLLLLLAANSGKRLRDIKVSGFVGLFCALFAVIFFISVYGNLRSGFSWNDCSYIKSLGAFNNYPDWLSDHFLWAYTYITNPLANLNYNFEIGNTTGGTLALISSFIPETFSKSYLSQALDVFYVRPALNASTGYVSFACSAGYFGLVIAFVVQFAYYALLRVIVRRMPQFAAFGEACLCFLVLVSLFYNPFAVSAVCYIPLYLVITVVCLKHKEKRTGYHSMSKKMQNCLNESSDDVYARTS